jgi:hypothetical protein
VWWRTREKPPAPCRHLLLQDQTGSTGQNSHHRNKPIWYMVQPPPSLSRPDQTTRPTTSRCFSRITLRAGNDTISHLIVVNTAYPVHIAPSVSIIRTPTAWPQRRRSRLTQFLTSPHTELHSPESHNTLPHQTRVRHNSTKEHHSLFIHFYKITSSVVEISQSPKSNHLQLSTFYTTPPIHNDYRYGLVTRLLSCL